MTAGIRIYNDSNYIQLTDEFKSYVLAQKGTVTLGAAEVVSGAGGTWTTGNMAKIIIPNTSGRSPLVALRCSVSIVMYRSILNGSNWEISVAAKQGDANSGVVVSYWAFDQTPDTVAATSGLKIFDAAGKCQYHSSLFPMRVTDFQTNGGGSGNFSIASGRTIAIIPLVIGMSNTTPVPAGAWTTYFSGAGVTTAATNTGTYTSTRYMMHQNSIRIGSANGTGNWAAAAIDVTNY